MSFEVAPLLPSRLSPIPPEIIHRSCEFIPYESVAILPLVNKNWLHAMGFSLPRKSNANSNSFWNRGISWIQQSFSSQKYSPLPQIKANLEKLETDRQNHFEELELEFWNPLVIQSFRASSILLSKLPIGQTTSSIGRFVYPAYRKEGWFTTEMQLGSCFGLELLISIKNTNRRFLLSLKNAASSGISRENGLLKQTKLPSSIVFRNETLSKVVITSDFFNIEEFQQQNGYEELEWACRLAKAWEHPTDANLPPAIKEFSSLLKGTHSKYELKNPPIQDVQKFSWPFWTDPKILSSQTEADLQQIHSSSSVEIGDVPVPGSKKRKTQSS